MPAFALSRKLIAVSSGGRPRDRKAVADARPSMRNRRQPVGDAAGSVGTGADDLAVDGTQSSRYE